ncbi:MAG: hypothetical protein RQ728_05070 [Brevefilum sp.]|nr:hypothetical protein [Brevefilum sp.]MDT8381609.1 hypothetical protein [Brevefilum sp.]MDW7753843.1 hypothetical protein [Brevefilum sp.]
MHKRILLSLIFAMLTIMIITACSRTPATANWEVFTIKEAAGFDIQFQVPPDWETNYILPMETALGQWKVTLTPPRCSPDQVAEYEEDCITLTAYIKGEAAFDEDAVLALLSQNIPLDQEGAAESILMGQTSFEVDGLTIKRFNHKIASANGEVQLSYYYFQTENAYYTIMADFPYNEREGEIAQEFQKILESIVVLD